MVAPSFLATLCLHRVSDLRNLPDSHFRFVSLAQRHFESATLEQNDLERIVQSNLLNDDQCFPRRGDSGSDVGFTKRKSSEGTQVTYLQIEARNPFNVFLKVARLCFLEAKSSPLRSQAIRVESRPVAQICMHAIAHLDDEPSCRAKCRLFPPSSLFWREVGRVNPSCNVIAAQCILCRFLSPWLHTEIISCPS